MEQDPARSSREWKYLGVLVALVAGLLLQVLLLPCLCYRGTVKMQIALAADAIVLVRLLVARIRRERGNGWAFYAILPFLAILVAELAVSLADPH